MRGHEVAWAFASAKWLSCRKPATQLCYCLRQLFGPFSGLQLLQLPRGECRRSSMPSQFGGLGELGAPRSAAGRCARLSVSPAIALRQFPLS